jgi:hypothetical protein
MQCVWQFYKGKPESRLLKNAASGLESGAHRFDKNSAQQPQHTWAVHEGKSETGATRPGSRRRATSVAGLDNRK